MYTAIRPVLAVSALVLSMAAPAAYAATVNEFGGASSWQPTDVRTGGTAEIVDLTGVGGALENDVRLGSGVAKLTTNGTNIAKAEVGVAGNFGTMADFIAGGSLSFSFFKASIGDTSPFAAAAIKLTVLDPTTSAADSFGTFVYEPTWNQAAPNASTAVPTDTWLDVLIDGLSGVLWHTGIYGAANQGGGPGKTLADWNTFFAGDLASAVIVGIAVGVGTYNQNQTAYFDNIKFKNGSINAEYDFELASVPGPAALPLLLSGIGLMGMLATRRKKPTAA